MNLVGDVEEITSDQLTVSYVQQLKSTLKMKHEECLALQKSNSKLHQKITELQEKLYLAESQRDFEIVKSQLTLSCSDKNSCPSEIIRIVSSWFPDTVDATIACCLKTDDSWIVVEEQSGCQKIPFSSALDDIVLCCALSDDGISGTELIPESILRALGWSPLHKSAAITIYSSCVWVIIGINIQDIKMIIPGLHSLLIVATELLIPRVTNFMKEAEADWKISRVEVSLEVCKLLIRPKLAGSDHLSPGTSGKRRRKKILLQSPDGLENSTADECQQPLTSVVGKRINGLNCQQIFQSIARRLQSCINGCESELLLFLDTHDCGTHDYLQSVIISSNRGIYSESSTSHIPRSLTEKVIANKLEMYIHPGGLSSEVIYHNWIDFGVDSELEHSSDHASISLLIIPIWSEPKSFKNSSTCLSVSGAIIFRLSRQFTEFELKTLSDVCRDNQSLIRQWVELNLETLLQSYDILPGLQFELDFEPNPLELISNASQDSIFQMIQNWTRFDLRANCNGVKEKNSLSSSYSYFGILETAFFTLFRSLFKFVQFPRAIEPFLESAVYHHSGSHGFVRNTKTQPDQESRFFSDFWSRELLETAPNVLEISSNLRLYSNLELAHGAKFNQIDMIEITLDEERETPTGVILFALDLQILSPIRANPQIFQYFLSQLKSMTLIAQNLWTREKKLIEHESQHHLETANLLNFFSEIIELMKGIDNNFVPTQDVAIENLQSLEKILPNILDSSRRTLKSLKQRDSLDQFIRRISSTISSSTFPNSFPLTQNQINPEQNILENIQELCLISQYSTFFLNCLIEKLCSKEMNDELTQWLCSIAASFTSLNPGYFISSTPASAQSWSVIWLDNYETIPHHHSSHRILDFETFQEVLEMKQPNYINLVDQIQEGVSYQVYYWPLFSRQTISQLNLSLISSEIRNHLDSFERDEDRHVIGILQCQITKNSDDPQIYSPQSLSQTSLLTFFNQVMSQVYSHISQENSDITGFPSENQSSTLMKTDNSILHSANPVEEKFSEKFFADINSLFNISSTFLIGKSVVQEQMNLTQITHEYLSKISQTIWEHSCHHQLSAVGAFLKADNIAVHPRPYFLGSIRSSELRTIQLRDDEENQSISIHFNPNSRVTECEVTFDDFVNLIPDINDQEISYGISILDQFLEKPPDAGENDAAIDSVSNIYRVIYPIYHSFLDSEIEVPSQTSPVGYLIAEYLFTTPNQMEVEFGLLVSKILQMWTEKLYFWFIHDVDLSLLYVRKNMCHSDELSRERSEELDELNEDFQRISENLHDMRECRRLEDLLRCELIFPPSVSSDGFTHPHSDTSSWSLLWYGDDPRDRKNIQEHLKKMFGNIQSYIYQLNKSLISSSFVTSVDLNTIQEVTDLLNHSLQSNFNQQRRDTTVFSEFFSSSSLSHLYVSRAGDVIYASNIQTLDQPQTLLNFPPFETSKAHLIALAIVCNAVVITEPGYNGAVETHHYYPVGCFPIPLGAWGLVISSLENLTALNVESSEIDKVVLPILQNISQWFKATYNFRKGLSSSLEIQHHRTLVRQISAIHTSVRRIISRESVPSIHLLAAAFERNFCLTSNDDKIANYLTSGKLHWQDASTTAQPSSKHSYQWSMVEVSTNEQYQIVSSNLDERIVDNLKTHDIVFTDWSIIKNFHKFNIYLKINISSEMFIVHLTCQLPDDFYSQQIKHHASGFRSLECESEVSPIDNFRSFLRLFQFYFLDFIWKVKQSSFQDCDRSAPVATQAKQGEITFRLLETLYSKQNLSSSSQQDHVVKKSEFSRVASLLPLVESILSTLPNINSVEINCYDTSDNTLLYQTQQRLLTDQIIPPNGMIASTSSTQSDPISFDEPKQSNLYLSNLSELTPITNLTFSRNHSGLNFIGTPIPPPHPTISAPLLPPHPLPSSIVRPMEERDEGILRIESLAQHSTGFRNSLESPKSYSSQSPHSVKERLHSHPIKFQVYEIQGTITFFSSVNLNHELLPLATLVRVIGRRIYELYRGKRNKKLLANLQREYEANRKSLEQKFIEVASLQSSYVQLQQEIQELEIGNERLKMMVKKDDHLRDANQDLKRDLERHYNLLLDDCKSREYESKVDILTKTIEALKSQCEHLTSLLGDEEQSGRRRHEIETLKRELQYAAERATKAERRKRELATELLAQRTNNESVIQELESKVTKFENELTQQQLFENKLREAYQITEGQLVESKNKIAALEQELMAKRSSNHFMLQQLESTTRALRSNQDELISQKVSGLSGINDRPIRTPESRSRLPVTVRRSISPTATNRKRSI